MKIRHYQKDDVPAMRALWKTVFDEREAYLDAFFTLLEDIGGAAVAIDETGALCGAAYAMTGYELLADGASPHVGYVYAVAVEERARRRGLGAALSRRAAEICRELTRMLMAKYPKLRWINREDDMGIEALRRSKESYKPAYRLKKYTARWIGE